MPEHHTNPFDVDGGPYEMPTGVGSSVTANRCPKVYVPNAGLDPEQYGMKLSDCVARLLDHIRADCPQQVAVQNMLNFVLLDRRDDRYDFPVDAAEVEKLGVRIIRADLIASHDGPALDEDRVIALLLSLT